MKLLLNLNKTCRVALALVRSHMNGLIPFESTKEQTTETMRTENNNNCKKAKLTITSLRDLLNFGLILLLTILIRCILLFLTFVITQFLVLSLAIYFSLLVTLL